MTARFAVTSHPFVQRVRPRPCQRYAAAVPDYFASSWLVSRLTLIARRRCFSLDICNPYTLARLPVNRSIRGRRARAPAVRSPAPLSRPGVPKPHHSGVMRSHVTTRLMPLWSASSHSARCSSTAWHKATVLNPGLPRFVISVAPPRRSVFSYERRRESPSDIPCRAPARLQCSLAQSFAREPGTLSPPSHQRQRLPRPRMPSIDKLFPAGRALGSPFVWDGNPPPIPRFCHRGPASSTLSLLYALAFVS